MTLPLLPQSIQAATRFRNPRGCKVANDSSHPECCLATCGKIPTSSPNLPIHTRDLDPIKILTYGYFSTLDWQGMENIAEENSSVFSIIQISSVNQSSSIWSFNFRNRTGLKFHQLKTWFMLQPSKVQYNHVSVETLICTCIGAPELCVFMTRCQIHPLISNHVHPQGNSCWRWHFQWL